MDKSTAETMREHNQQLVLQKLFNAEATSRSEIAAQLNLHKSTISSIYRDLDEMGYIEELGEGETSEIGGRRPKLVRFSRQYGYVMSFDMGHRHLRVSSVRLTGEVIEEQVIHVQNQSVQAVIEQMQNLLKNADKLGTQQGLLGVAVGIHGVVDNNKVTYSPFFDYSQIDVAAALASVVDVPVLLENEANLAAVYTRDFHDYAKSTIYQNLAVVNVHYGIGAGMIVEKRLYRGLHGQAGEIGRSAASVSADGHVVRLEDLYSEEAMLSRFASQTGRAVERDDFLAALKADDRTAQRMIGEWISGIAVAIFNLIQQNAPEAVFIHSRFIAELPDLLGEVVGAYQQMNPIGDTEIFFANNSVYRATMLGGVALVTRNLLGLAGLDLRFHN